MNDTINRPTNSGWKPHEGKAYVYRDLPRRTVGDLQLIQDYLEMKLRL